ncbi:hypothetical protein H6G80_23280 [Nostoc sp. FACHB-87]|uniref:hypothetical protein n=1 Tax=Nostocales TaxID=1161 RepID=UPI001684DD08|nr:MULTISPECIES: hypothetical protein [Nostocales]MBD2301132.1 hypothetical protein [Nostoc sp. FACHB-190]MBD2456985.1 hypothetical protein [Nostoc sp. FACHB-87]MBD2477103.1 hypothetical protein [Anabaena sp. FACHB-83]MBD2491159.1 hypothetical protein [Aulosira sp. FACHB-615]
MKNLIKVLVLALAVSSPLAVITPAVHAETTSTTKTAPLAKIDTSKTHHKAAITKSKSQVKSGKHTKHLKHHKHHKHTATNLTNKSNTAANKAHK